MQYAPTYFTLMEKQHKQIKVCGMRDPQNIEALATLPITFMGTIFYHKSPRFSGHREDTAQAFRQLPSSIKSVGVFVKPTLAYLQEMQEKFALDYLQLHSDEDLEFCRAAQKIAPIIKAFGIATDTNFSDIEKYSAVADLFIFDTATKAYGGSGKQFDWSLLEQYKGDTPYLLAGGITLADAQALQNIGDPRCKGFDINSGFESSPALKNIDTIAQFLSDIHPIEPTEDRV